MAPAAERPIRIGLLELLLFLSAMLAGLTGLISGDRAVEARQVERAAIALSAAAEAGGEEADVAAGIVRSSQPRLAAASIPEPTAAADTAPQSAPVDERRLE